jgi:hypothetical protein
MRWLLKWLGGKEREREREREREDWMVDRRAVIFGA